MSDDNTVGFQDPNTSNENSAENSTDRPDSSTGGVTTHKMATQTSAPKQWCLTERETLSTYESWKENLVFRLSLEQSFKPFLKPTATWTKKTKTVARDAALELMLGQIANFTPLMNRAEITKRSTCMNDIWQNIRAYYGFQTSGAQFLKILNIAHNPEKRPEQTFQELQAFVEDTLLQAGGTITHHGVAATEDEELSPTTENFIVYEWLYKVNPGLIPIIEQKYATELRTRTLASLKPEISQALPALLDEVETVKVMRAGINFPRQQSNRQRASSNSHCELCKVAGRQTINHPLSSCKFLPAADMAYFKRLKARSATIDDGEGDMLDCLEIDEPLADMNLGSSGSGKSIPLPSKSSQAFQIYRICKGSSPKLPVHHKGQKLILTLDSGAEATLFDEKAVLQLRIPLHATKCHAFQADGRTPLHVLGEANVAVNHLGHTLKLDGLVIRGLDVPVLAGQPFFIDNDISIRPAENLIKIGNDYSYYYKSDDTPKDSTKARAILLRCPEDTTIWPGQSIELSLDSFDDKADVAIHPSSTRTDLFNDSYMWPGPAITSVRCGKVSIPNSSQHPIKLAKHEHIGYALPTTSSTEQRGPGPSLSRTPSSKPVDSYDQVRVDSSNLSPEWVRKFTFLHAEHACVFDGQLVGYNGAMGDIQAEVHMGPTQPPQHKGKVPQYNHGKLQLLQEKFDELESMGIFAKPEDINISVEYVNPSFLVSAPGKSDRLVTAFTEVGQYTKPQPSKMSNCNQALQCIGTWKYLIKSDLKKSYFQIPLRHESRKYCGVVSPFRGMRVYVRAAMGMPGSETALEELMCRLFGDLLKEGSMVKVCDDVFIGSDSLENLLLTWEKVLDICTRCNLRLSPSKTDVCPTTTTVLGWIWSSGRLSASSHMISTLASCEMPGTTKAMRSYIGAYKVLGRVIKHTAQVLDPLEAACAGKDSKTKIEESCELRDTFTKSQDLLRSPNTLTCPRPNDQLWIVTDGSTSKDGLGATLYVFRCGKLHLSGFFSAKLKKHQHTWLPCEMEALGIAAAVKHFAPYIIESGQQARVLTDSKPCVQAYNKLRRGQYSNSPRLTTFLSTASQYQVTISHLAGTANLPSDFASRNAPPCVTPACQVCTFIKELESVSVREVTVSDVLSGRCSVPFANRAAWKSAQLECPDIRRAHAHLSQGTRPGKKATKIKDVKRYLNVATISKDNLLVVKKDDPLSHSYDCIVIPRSAIEGLLTALHLKLSHPTKHQLKRMFQRCFYALDIDRYIDRVTDTCHPCNSLKHFPKIVNEQSSEPPSESVGTSFAADVFKIPRQSLLVLRDTVSSYTIACAVENEREDTMCSALLQLVSRLRPADGPPAAIRVDPAPGFTAIHNKDRLKAYNVSLVIGNPKNSNKNPVAERAVSEMREEINRMFPNFAFLDPAEIELVCQRLNSRIRFSGLSSHEVLTGRNQFTNNTIPIDDFSIAMKQHENRLKNHAFSEKSKLRSGFNPRFTDIQKGDLVYFYSDGSKLSPRSRYLVLSVNLPTCEIRKFTSQQFRGKSYTVRVSELYRVPKSSLLESDDVFQKPFSVGLNDSIVVNPVDSSNAPSSAESPALDILTRPEPPVNSNLDSEEPVSVMTGDTSPAPTAPASPSRDSRPKRLRRPNVRLKDYTVYRSIFTTNQ